MTHYQFVILSRQLEYISIMLGLILALLLGAGVLVLGQFLIARKKDRHA